MVYPILIKDCQINYVNFMKTKSNPNVINSKTWKPMIGKVPRIPDVEFEPLGSKRARMPWRFPISLFAKFR